MTYFPCLNKYDAKRKQVWYRWWRDTDVAWKKNATGNVFVKGFPASTQIEYIVGRENMCHLFDRDVQAVLMLNVVNWSNEFNSLYCIDSGNVVCSCKNLLFFLNPAVPVDWFLVFTSDTQNYQGHFGWEYLMLWLKFKFSYMCTWPKERSKERPRLWLPLARVYGVRGWRAMHPGTRRRRHKSDEVKSTSNGCQNPNRSTMAKRYSDSSVTLDTNYLPLGNTIPTLKIWNPHRPQIFPSCLSVIGRSHDSVFSVGFPGAVWHRQGVGG